MGGIMEYNGAAVIACGSPSMSSVEIFVYRLCSWVVVDAIVFICCNSPVEGWGNCAILYVCLAGAAIVAMTGENCVAIASDTRMGVPQQSPCQQPWTLRNGASQSVLFCAGQAAPDDGMQPQENIRSDGQVLRGAVRFGQQPL
eukprot:4185645-Amphidinium_carterae.1